MIYINIYLFLCVFTFISYECVYTGLNMNMYVPIDKVSFIYAYKYTTYRPNIQGIQFLSNLPLVILLLEIVYSPPLRAIQ